MENIKNFHAPSSHIHTFPTRGAHWLQLINLWGHMVTAQSPQATLELTAAGYHMCLMHSDVNPSLQHHTQGVHGPESLILCSFLSLPLNSGSHHSTSRVCSLPSPSHAAGVTLQPFLFCFTCNLHMTPPPRVFSWSDFISFCCLIFHCLDVLQVVYPFIL